MKKIVVLTIYIYIYIYIFVLLSVCSSESRPEAIEGGEIWRVESDETALRHSGRQGEGTEGVYTSLRKGESGHYSHVHFFFFFFVVVVVVVFCVVSLSVIKDDDDFPEGVQEK